MLTQIEALSKKRMPRQLSKSDLRLLLSDSDVPITNYRLRTYFITKEFLEKIGLTGEEYKKYKLFCPCITRKIVNYFKLTADDF